MEAKDYIDKLRGMGLSQQDIADRTSIPQPSISKIERGEIKDILSRSYRQLQALYESVLKEVRKHERNQRRAVE